MSETTEYFSMQGRVYVGDVNADGSWAPAKWVYDASTLSTKMTKETEEKKESYLGQRGTAAVRPTGTSLEVSLTLGQINTDTMAMATDGVRVDIASGTVTAESVGTVAAGNVVALEFSAVSDLVLKDGTADLLVENTDYTTDLDLGIVTFLTAKTGVTAAYDYAAHSVATMLNGPSKDRYVLFAGLNTVEGSVLRCRGEIYRVGFNPAEELAFIQDAFGELSLTGKAKVDPVRQPSAKFGPYGRVILVPANG